MALHYCLLERMFLLAGHAAEFRASLQECHCANDVVAKDARDEGAMFLQVKHNGWYSCRPSCLQDNIFLQSAMITDTQAVAYIFYNIFLQLESITDTR